MTVSMAQAASASTGGTFSSTSGGNQVEGIVDEPIVNDRRPGVASFVGCDEAFRLAKCFLEVSSIGRSLRYVCRILDARSLSPAVAKAFASRGSTSWACW